MSRLKFLSIKLVLLLALLPSLIIISSMIRSTVYDVYGKVYFKYTYIESIDTPSYNNQTKKILEEFNSYTDNKVVSFSKINNGRPIKIQEMKDSDVISDPFVLGWANVHLSFCLITVKKHLSKEDYRETLIHEFLHCFNYMHVSNPQDLMYYQLNYLDKEESIRQYATKVRKKFYE